VIPPRAAVSLRVESSWQLAKRWTGKSQTGSIDRVRVRVCVLVLRELLQAAGGPKVWNCGLASGRRSVR